jgi:hypothetical protein
MTTLRNQVLPPQVGQTRQVESKFGDIRELNIEELEERIAPGRRPPTT